MFYKLNEKLIFFKKKPQNSCFCLEVWLNQTLSVFPLLVYRPELSLDHGGKEASYGSAGYSHNQQMASTVSSLPLGQQ